MNLHEQISRMKSIMGLIVENEDEKSSAPWGIIFDGANKILVGDMHQTPVELSKEYEDKVVETANKFGYYGEGIGLEHNKAITDSDFFRRLDPKKYKGSWDELLIKSGTIENKDKILFLYSLFSNVKENHRLEKLIDESKEGETILDLLTRTIPSWSAEMGEFNLEKKDLIEFLKQVSEKNIDFIALLEKEATKENLDDFLTKVEKLQWPKKNWMDYPNNAGKFARNATRLRDKFLINAEKGVYFVGAGHLKDIIEMEEGKNKNLQLIGGEKI